MDIKTLRPFDQNNDGRINKAELLKGLGKAADDKHVDADEAKALGIGSGDASQLNKALKDSARGKAETTVFLLEDRPVRVQAMGGAIFDKTESNADKDYRGISAEVRLPDPSFDPGRYFAGSAKTPTYKIGPLDRPSVYMGGTAERADGSQRIMDVGLCWDRVYSSEGLETFTDVVPAGQAHGCDGGDPARRFVMDAKAQVYELDGKRYYLLRAKTDAETYSEDRSLLVDAKGKAYTGAEAAALKTRLASLKPATQAVILDGNHRLVAAGAAATAKAASLKPDFAYRPYWRTTDQGKNQWHNPELTGGQNLYFYPGEQLRMTVKETGSGRDNIDLRIERAGKNAPSFKTRFSQDGFGEGRPQAFKYVHSLDQFKIHEGQRVGNEDGAIIPTASSLHNARWQPFLIGRDGKHQAMNTGNSMAVGAPDTSADSARRAAIFKQDSQGEHIAPTNQLP